MIFLFQSLLFATYKGENFCPDLGISDFSYFNLEETHYDTTSHDNYWENDQEDDFTDEEKKNIITHILFHPTHEKDISVEDDTRIPLIVIHGLDANNDLDPTIKADTSNLCKSLQKQKEFLIDTEESYFSVMNGFLSQDYIRDKYRVYYYSYPTHKHITFNAKKLSNLLYEDKYIKSCIKNNRKLTFLAHSMGGLVARSMLEEHNGIWYEENGSWNNIGTNIILDQLITLGTPHHGSPASSGAWFDMGLDGDDVIIKDIPNRKNPGVQDLNWDNYDNIFDLVQVREDIFNLNLVKPNNTYSCSDERLEELKEWYNDTTESRYSFVEDFDKEYLKKKELNTENNIQEVCYIGVEYLPLANNYFKAKLQIPTYPNPWLTYLNKTLDGKDTSYKNKYIFYGSFNDTATEGKSNIINDDGMVNSWLTYSGWLSGYLNDYIVPLTSSLLDTSLDAPDTLKDSGDKMIGTSEIISFAETQKEYLKIVDSISPKIRVFKDYHHSRIHSGSFYSEPKDMFNSNQLAGILDEKTHKNYIKQAFNEEYDTFVDNNFDLIKSDKIKYDPLYIRLALDLGVDVNNLLNIEENCFLDLAEAEEYQRQSICKLKSKGIIDSEKVNYNPTDSINRAEFLKILFFANDERNINVTTPNQKFIDVADDAWYKDLIYKGVEDDFLTGYSDNTFKPQNPINFAEAAKILVTYFRISTEANNSYKGDEWYESFVYRLWEKYKITYEPREDDIYKNDEIDYDPNHFITRGEMAFMIATVKEFLDEN